jgi:threonine dehydrogenase-like Zn-dependent dehydrogenase
VLQDDHRDHPGPIGGRPLQAVELPEPEPGPGKVRVLTCGVCRTDRYLAVGDLAPRRPLTVPGHEVVGVVDVRGPGATRFVRPTVSPQPLAEADEVLADLAADGVVGAAVLGC